MVLKSYFPQNIRYQYKSERLIESEAIGVGE